MSSSVAAKFRQEQEIIILNVGGTRFETRRVTLCQRPSMLSVMFGGGVFAAPAPDAQGEFFFDRDPTHFRYLLNFLRTGKVFLPEARHKQLELLLEAEYFGIDAVTTAIKRIHHLPRQFSLSASSSFEEKKHSPPRAWEGIEREGLLVSLEASSLDLLYNYEQPSCNVWADSRGPATATFVHGVFVGASPVIGEDEQNVRFVELGPTTGYVSIPINISPLVRPVLTVEVWVNLLSVVPGSNGWLLGQAGGEMASLARSVSLHDERYGTTNGVGHLGVGVGTLFTNPLGTVPLRQWSHIVVTWDQPRQGRSSMTVHLNRMAFEPRIELRDIESSMYFTLGQPSPFFSPALPSSASSSSSSSTATSSASLNNIHANNSLSGVGCGVHCQVAALRIYEHRLSAEQIDANFKSFNAMFPSPNTCPEQSFIGSSVPLSPKSVYS